jgi:hypothetical protein
MTNTNTATILAAVAHLPADKRLIVLEAARLIRTARDAGDTRPAAEIVAHLLAAPRDKRTC